MALARQHWNADPLKLGDFASATRFTLLATRSSRKEKGVILLKQKTKPWVPCAAAWLSKGPTVRVAVYHRHGAACQDWGGQDARDDVPATHDATKYREVKNNVL
ncbi:hypothetical protein PspLS_07810 [Pyricularia sp. CBS 133598]|nr:hypothetical protein PspLS_07810 [Pyricularia sp. CBS 133598]